jgi:hypothetical protein
MEREPFRTTATLARHAKTRLTILSLAAVSLMTSPQQAPLHCPAMSLPKLLIALAVVGFAYHYWSQHRTGGEAGAHESASVGASGNGFVELPPITGADARSVLVIAAEGCPEEAAQRADRLAEQLARAGVPVARMHDVSFNIPNGDPEIAQRVLSVMNGELPIVFVRGKAKSNPTPEQVASEYGVALR